MSSIWVVLGLATTSNLKIEQLDVKTNFLHGKLIEEIYMEQPKGFEEKGKKHMVCKLKKSHYAWNMRQDNGTKSLIHSWWVKTTSRLMKIILYMSNISLEVI